MIDSGGGTELPEVTLGDYYYDLEITAIQSRSGTLSELNVYESISDNFKKIVSVRGPDGRALHNLDVSFGIVPPEGEGGRYTMIVALDSTHPSTKLAVQRYDFRPDQTHTAEAPTAYAYHAKHCANLLRARGDIAVTLCEADSTLRIYSVADLSLVADVEFDYYARGSWILLGEQGFDIVQNGNGYLIFFSSVETAAYSYLLHAVEFLYDPTQGSWAGHSAYQLKLHPRLATHWQPFQFEVGLDGAYATWLAEDSKDLQVQRICSYSEYYAEGECLQCPPGEFGLAVNAASCVSCAVHVGGQLDARFNFLCGRRGRVFKPVQSGAALNRENKHSLQQHRREKAAANQVRMAEQQR